MWGILCQPVFRVEPAMHQGFADKLCDADRIYGVAFCLCSHSILDSQSFYA